MNCTACGATALRGPSPLVCGTCLGTALTPSASPPPSRAPAPLRGRRWLLRRAGPRKDADPAPELDPDVRRKLDLAAFTAAAAARRPDPPCARDREPRPAELDLDPDNDDDPDPDADAASLEVSAPHSETASTVSRAALSVADRADLDARDPPAILTRAAATAREEARVANRESALRDDARARLRAAYVRELLLSSLSL